MDVVPVCSAEYRWAYARDFRERFPNVRLEEDRNLGNKPVKFLAVFMGSKSMPYILHPPMKKAGELAG
jgi:hypothetical protein